MKHWALWLLFAVAVFLSVVLLVPDLRRAIVPSGAVALTCAVIVAWIFVLTRTIEPLAKWYQDAESGISRRLSLETLADIDHWREAGFECENPFKNTGAGAAMLRVEAARRIFPGCRFNEKTTEAGRDALGYYHERRDENRNAGLGPEHSWASHAADSFGYMAISYEEPPIKQGKASGRQEARPVWTHWSS
jgi:hypothetical protein